MKLAFALISLALAARVEAGWFSKPARPDLTGARRLEVDQQDQMDDQVLFGSTDIKGESELSNQLLMATMDKTPIDFNQNLESIQAQIDAARRNIDTTLPNNVRISALNAYINNAVIMNKLGMLDDAEDESLINPNAESYIAERKVRKLTKSIRANVGVGLKKASKTLSSNSGVKTARKAKLYSPKNRKLVKESPSEAKTEAKVDTPAVGHPQERRLAMTWTARAPKLHLPPKPKNYHISQIRKMRANDELMELAKKGSLFTVDMSSIYKVSDEDLNRYMDRTDGAKNGSI